MRYSGSLLPQPSHLHIHTLRFVPRLEILMDDVVKAELACVVLS